MASERMVLGDAPGPAPLILLMTFGTGGDVQPFLTLAAGLNDRGHRTLLIVPRYHEAMAQEAGLAHVAFGTREQALAVLDDPDLWHERKGFGVVWRGLLPSVQAVCELLMSHAQARPCVVLSHPFLVPVAAMARARRPSLRIVCACLAPSTLRTVHDPLSIGSLEIPSWVPLGLRRVLWRSVDRWGIDPDLLPGLNAARAHQGLAPVASFLDHMQSASDATVGLFPPWFAHRQPDWPPTFIDGDFPLRPRPASTALPADLEAFLAAGPAPIAFTPGTGHRHAAAHFDSALAALRALGRRGLLITTHAAQVPQPLPPDVQWLPHAPFDRLLPRVALLVHHGGIGTTAEALRAGIPQLILPWAFDQFDNGRRIEQLGAGAVLPAARATPRRLVRAMGRLLSNAARPAVEALHSGAQDGRALNGLLDRVESALTIHPTHRP